jgi:hypothetical protein
LQCVGALFDEFPVKHVVDLVNLALGAKLRFAALDTVRTLLAVEYPLQIDAPRFGLVNSATDHRETGRRESDVHFCRRQHRITR